MFVHMHSYISNLNTHKHHGVKVVSHLNQLQQTIPGPSSVARVTVRYTHVHGHTQQRYMHFSTQELQFLQTRSVASHSHTYMYMHTYLVTLYANNYAYFSPVFMCKHMYKLTLTLSGWLHVCLTRDVFNYCVVPEVCNQCTCSCTKALM